MNRNIAALVFSLIPSAVWGAPAGRIFSLSGGNDQGGQILGQRDAPSGDDFVAIDAGQGAHCLAVRADCLLAGSRWNFGISDFGPGDVFYSHAVVSAGNDFKAVVTGALHSLALETGGSVVAWYANGGILTFDAVLVVEERDVSCGVSDRR